MLAGRVSDVRKEARRIPLLTQTISNEDTEERRSLGRRHPLTKSDGVDQGDRGEDEGEAKRGDPKASSDVVASVACSDASSCGLSDYHPRNQLERDDGDVDHLEQSQWTVSDMRAPRSC